MHHATLFAQISLFKSKGDAQTQPNPYRKHSQHPLPCKITKRRIDHHAPDRTSGHALLLIRTRPRRVHAPSNIKMRPSDRRLITLQAIHERFQEHSGSDASCRSSTSLHCVALRQRTEADGSYEPSSAKTTHVLEVGVGRVDLEPVLVVQRHAPESVVLDLTGGVQLLPQRVGALFSAIM